MNTIVFLQSFKSWKYKAKSILFNKSKQPDAANVFAPSGARNVSRIMIAGVELRRRDSNKPTTNERLCSIIRGGPRGGGGSRAPTPSM